MEKLGRGWSGLNMQRRVIVLAAAAGVFLGVLLLARQAVTPRMELLYAGLDPAAAGEVITALEARATPFEVRGSAIFVEAASRDALRMSLAGEGLPTNGASGYELLDTLSGFGTTAQMFDAAYWRAKEGELARTITTSAHISSARVHIANAPSGPFRQVGRTSASVTVSANGSLSGAQADALRFLVASSVSGLNPENVSVIDARSGLIANSDSAAGAISSGQGLAEALRSNVLRLLEARVGAGNAEVEVSVETISEREAISERTFDPDSRVAISSENEETSSRAADSRNGAVTVASNLPEGEAGAGSGTNESNETRTREITNYEVSETQRDVLREPGGIARLSVAVLVNGQSRTDTDGVSIWQPRSADELEVLRDLVASAVGLNETRGDQLTIRSLEFQSPPEVGVPAPPGFLETLALDVMGLIQIAVLALVTLILGLFVVRPLLITRAAPVIAELPPPNGSLPDFEALPPLNGDIQETGDSLPPLPALPDLGDFSPAPEDPGQKLRRLIEGKPDESIEILAKWMREDAEVAK